MSEMRNMSEEYPRTGKHVGDFSYDDTGEVEPVLENEPHWVRMGDAEGWMNPRSDGSFELDPPDPNDERFTRGIDIGPRSVDMIPAGGIPVDIWQIPPDLENDPNPDFDVWRGAVYNPKRET
jgi:hypothetical protein